jgi:hypothetical protein
MLAANAAGSHSFRPQMSEHRLGTRPIRGAVEPDLRLRDIGRDLTDDALNMLVEHMRWNTRLLQAVQQQIRIETIQGDVEALHPPMSQAASLFVKASE